MKTVHKYSLTVEDSVSVKMPVGSQVLSAQMQDGRPYIWALVDDSVKEEETRTFHVVGTGHNADRCSGLQFVGTFQLLGGSFVFHVFVSASSS